MITGSLNLKAIACLGGRLMPVVGGGVLSLMIAAIAPASAQEAAFDDPKQNPAFVGGAGTMPGRPLSTSAAVGTKSNLRHWQAFSQGSKSAFLRVPAGTVLKGTEKNTHYTKPRHIQIGQNKEDKKGSVVRRYLAYNLPAGAYLKQSSTAASSTKPSKAGKSSKQSSGLVPVLSYSGHTSYISHSASSAKATPISFYASYH